MSRSEAAAVSQSRRTTELESPLAAPRGHARISRPAALLSTVVALATRSRAARVPSVGHTSALALALRTTQTRAAPHLGTAVALATVLPVGADDAAALPLVERFADLVTRHIGGTSPWKVTRCAVHQKGTHTQPTQSKRTLGTP